MNTKGNTKMSKYQVNKPMKYNGKQYKPGDAIELDGMWDDVLIAKGSVVEVTAKKEAADASTRRKANRTKKRVRRPKK